MKFKYIWMFLVLAGLTSCESDDEGNVVIPEVELTAGEADFSKFISLGNSLTAGYTDNALFIAGQQSSMPNLMAQQFALVGGGAFNQPLTSDNIGGLTLGGNVIAPPRLFFDGAGPALLPAVPTTEVSNILSGPFNNLGVPGAKSFHLLANGYGNIGNVQLGLANPYFVRMASNPDASVIEDALAQSPTFFSLWIGNNDVLGYATTGGDGTNPITDQATFAGTYSAIVAALGSTGAKGLIANIPDVTSIPFFTTVPYNSVPLDAATANQLNAGFALYNGGIVQAFAFLVANNLISQADADAEIAKRTVVYSEGQNPMLIMDETLTDLTAINPGLVSMRPATADDLFVLTSSSFIGTTVGGNPTLINGVSVPLADNWVLLPSEQMEIKSATEAFNAVIQSAAQSGGYAYVDANGILNQMASSGYSDGDFTFTASLVLGGFFSLDGVHPNSRGFSMMANEALKAIDATYGSTFEASNNLLDVGDYPTNYPSSLQ
ncbi:MAG: G-D-S-L family lipolytic protein [Flavobacteriaceae bacterium]|nr:G-D-S-L family lipolytic protein [Flavobacteriaceae bacterium]